MQAVIWHYWIGAVLAASAVLTLLGLVGNYFFKVERTRYPKGLED